MLRVAAGVGVGLAAGLALAAAVRPRVMQVLRISRVVADLDRAEAFYRDRLGFARVAGPLATPGLPALLGLPGATVAERVMRLGDDHVALVCFDPPGPPYPAGSRSDDAWFQHLAIVVNDIDAAYRRLAAGPVTAISRDGPQRLPPANGSVVAFKFRDPDGHPLELIEFPPGQGRAVWHRRRAGPFLGIDHSAIGVTRWARSLGFYRRLGFHVAARSLNEGPAQQRLDGLDDARARITGLRPPAPAGPGLELLAYTPPGRQRPRQAANAVMTDWVTLAATGLPGGRPRLLRDPDGHLMLLVAAARRSRLG